MCPHLHTVDATDIVVVAPSPSWWMLVRKPVQCACALALRVPPDNNPLLGRIVGDPDTLCVRSLCGGDEGGEWLRSESRGTGPRFFARWRCTIEVHVAKTPDMRRWCIAWHTRVFTTFRRPVSWNVKSYFCQACQECTRQRRRCTATRHDRARRELTRFDVAAIQRSNTCRAYLRIKLCSVYNRSVQNASKLVLRIQNLFTCDTTEYRDLCVLSNSPPSRRAEQRLRPNTANHARLISPPCQNISQQKQGPALVPLLQRAASVDIRVDVDARTSD